ncbi:MAG: hypothetical protein H6699_08180 [Myxococcales bacterium]|nr:hypothetical protein [Myxococcales bacterium]
MSATKLLASMVAAVISAPLSGCVVFYDSTQVFNDPQDISDVASDAGGDASADDADADVGGGTDAHDADVGVDADVDAASDPPIDSEVGPDADTDGEVDITDVGPDADDGRDTRDTTDAADLGDTEDVDDIEGDADSGDAADATDVFETGDTSDTSDAADTGDTSDTSDATDTTETGDTSDTSDAADTTDTGDTSDTSDAADTTDTGDTSDTSDAADTTDTGDTSDTSDPDASDADGDTEIVVDCREIPVVNDPDGDFLDSSCDVCPDRVDPLQLDSNGDGIGDWCDDPDSDTVPSGPELGLSVELWTGYTRTKADEFTRLERPPDAVYPLESPIDFTGGAYLGNPLGETDLVVARVSGWLYVPRSGRYTFYVTSDDGSRLYIDGTREVDNDGEHTSRERSGSAELVQGSVFMALHAFQSDGTSRLRLEWEGPGLTREVIPASAFGRNDNCPYVANADQANSDANEAGDACQVATVECVDPPRNGATASWFTSLDVERCYTTTWEDGYCVEFYITNPDTRARDWSLGISVAGTITSAWGCTYSDGWLTTDFEGVAETNIIPPRGTVVCGFCADTGD